MVVVGDHSLVLVVMYLLVVEAMYFLLHPLELVLPQGGSLLISVDLVVLGWWWYTNILIQDLVFSVKLQL